MVFQFKRGQCKAYCKFLRTRYSLGPEGYTEIIAGVMGIPSKDSLVHLSRSLQARQGHTEKTWHFRCSYFRTGLGLGLRAKNLPKPWSFTASMS